MRSARNIHVLQAEASVAASDLVKTLNRLTETANMGLGQINGSVHLIGQHLQVHIDKAGQTWTNWPIQVLGFIFRGYSCLDSWRSTVECLSLTFILLRLI